MLEAIDDSPRDKVSYFETFWEGSTLLTNVLLILILLSLFALVIGLVVLCRRIVYTRCCRCAQTTLRKLEAKIMFNSVLRAILESYFLLAISTFHSFKKISFETKEETTSFVTSLALLGFLVAFPALSHRFLLRNQENLGKETSKDKYGSLYMNVDHYREVSLRFNLYFCLRRLIFAITIALLNGAIVCQILVTDFAVLAMLSFFIHRWPMINGLNNLVQVFNEMIILLIIVSLVVFTDFVPDPVVRYDLGHVLLYTVAVTMIVNLIILILGLLYAIYVGVRKFCSRR